MEASREFEIFTLFQKCILKKFSLTKKLSNMRPNLINLSGGLNLSGRSNIFGSTKNCIQFFKIYTSAQLKPVFGDLNRGSNSLNSDTVHIIIYIV